MTLTFELHKVMDLMKHAIDSVSHERVGSERDIDVEPTPSIWLVQIQGGGVYLQSNGFPNDIGPLAPCEVQDNAPIKCLKDMQFIEVLPIEKMVKGLQNITNYTKFIIDISRDKLDINLDQ